MRALAFKEGKLWVAQCVERDVCVQASTFAGLKAGLNEAFFFERKTAPLYRIPHTPKKVLEELPKNATPILFGDPATIRIEAKLDGIPDGRVYLRKSQRSLSRRVKIP